MANSSSPATEGATAGEVQIEISGGISQRRCDCQRGKTVDTGTELWAKSVVSFSSQYDGSGWSAAMVIGAPRVYPQYGDIRGAWAQGNCSNAEYIELGYEEKLYVEEMEIYETYNSGAVTRISLCNPTNQWVPVWEADSPSRITESRIFKPNLRTVNFQSDKVRLDMNCSVARTWCEIDAVKIKGKTLLVDPPPPLTTLSDDMHAMVNNSLFSDVTFLVENKTIHAHRNILAARSNYFRAMFCAGMKESSGKVKPITMPDVSHEAFLGMLQYVYTNMLDTSITPAVLVELMRAGDRFSMEGLKTLSHFYLAQEINVDNVVFIYREVTEKLPVLEDVEVTCLNFISHNLSEVSKTSSFCNLPQPLMLGIVQHAASQLSLT